MDQSKSGKLLSTLIGAPIAGGMGLFASKVIDRWGVLDASANALGDFLKGSDLSALIGFLFFAVLYAVLLRLIWGRSRGRPAIAQPAPKTTSEPTSLRGAFAKMGEVVHGYPHENLDPFEQLSPTVYLRNTAVKSPHFTDKMFGIKWVEKDISLTFRGDDSDPLNHTPTVEPTLTFEMFNAGGESVRHVVARWRLPNVELAEDVELLGSNIRSFKNGRLKMQGENGSASIQPVATEAESEPIPVIAPGATAELRAPTSFTTAYSIRALGRAKRQSIRNQGTDFRDVLDVLERWKEPMDHAMVDLTYVEAGKKRHQSFVIVGRVWGGTPPHVSTYDTKSSQVVYEHTPGIVATIDNVGVLHDDG